MTFIIQLISLISVAFFLVESFWVLDENSIRDKICRICINCRPKHCSENSQFNINMVTRAAGFVIFRHLENSIEYLLLKASYGSKHWTPPKGHVDPGESEWITALRETKEEAGLGEEDLEIYKDISKTLHYNVKGKPKEVIYWLAKLINPTTEVKLSEEHTDLKWLNLTEAQKLSGYEDFNKLLEEFDIQVKKIIS